MANFNEDGYAKAESVSAPSVLRTGEARSVENNGAFINPVLQGSSLERRRPAMSGERRLTRTKHIRSRVLLASAA